MSAWSAPEPTGTTPGLPLERYRDAVRLDEPFRFEVGARLSDSQIDAIVDHIVDHLLLREHLSDMDNRPADHAGRRRLLRGLLNIRPPQPLERGVLQELHRLLHDETIRRGIVNVDRLPCIADTFPTTALPHADTMTLWKGDISALGTDAIVNAANDRLLGCFHPLHNCIDNVIHSAAGPLLRQDCKTIMDIQGHPERTGDAKITRAFLLPSRFVLHTVGPIIGRDPPDRLQRQQLASCYRSCLTLADQLTDIRTMALPCISTGVFNFPREAAARIAIATVEEWLARHAHHFTRIIFNVFLQEDFDVYTRTFQRGLDR